MALIRREVGALPECSRGHSEEPRYHPCVRAELKSLDSADAPAGLDEFDPPDPESFALAVGATISPEGGEGGDLFYFLVCSPGWLKANPPEKGFAFLHGHLLLERWDYKLVERAIGDLCRGAEGSDWNEVAGQLRLYGDWEFENYREAV